jgi:NAD(P) transhydrogenase subunit alpha
LLLGILKESTPGETRVALLPESLKTLLAQGITITVESGAGIGAGASDLTYTQAGVMVSADRASILSQSDLLPVVNAPGAADQAMLKSGAVVIGFLRPLEAPQALATAIALHVSLFSMELVPRISRAQTMDALSSMATVAGYKAVIDAASYLPRLFPMLMTAAGTIPPARVFVIGAGVAGLQAISTARRLGAVASAYDMRAASKEQVQSLGGRFVELPVEAKDAQDARGYGTAQDETFYARQRELLTRVVAESDVVITSAVIPGKKSPVLITADMVKGMAPGSVIVDLAAERGGNCELTRAGETVDANGVSIIGALNLAGTVPYHASQMYARNLTTFLTYMMKEGKLQLNTQDEITRETMVTRGGEIVNARVRDFLKLPALAVQ